MTLWFSNWNQCLYNWISEQGWESFYLRALQPVDRPKRWTIRVMWTSYSSSPDPRGGRGVTHCSLTHKKHEEIFFVDAKRKISGVQFFVHGTRFSVTRSPECTKHNWGTWEALSLSLPVNGHSSTHGWCDVIALFRPRHTLCIPSLSLSIFLTTHTDCRSDMNLMII